MKQSQSRPLNNVILRLLLLQLLLPLLLLELLAVGLMGYTFEVQIEKQQLRQARSLAQTVDAYLEHAERILNAVALMADATTTDELVPYMQTTQQAYSYFETIYRLDGTGRVRALTPYDVRYEQVDMSQQPYFQRAREQDGVTISLPFTSLRTGQPTVWVGRQLQDGGLVVGELSLGALQEAIADRLEGSDRRTIFVTDDFGTLLAHPQSALVAQQTNVSDLKIVQRGLEGEVALPYLVDTSLFLGSAVRVEHTGWLVVIQTPFASVYAPYVGMIAAVFLLTLIIWAALMWRLRYMLNRRVVRPLTRLRRGADALADGDFAQGELLAAAPAAFSELSALIADFRRMGQAIQTRQVALQESEAKYRQLIEQSEDAVYLLYENRFEIINPKFEALFGITTKEACAPDFDFRRLVAPQSRPLIAARMRKMAAGEDVGPRYEFTALDKDGLEIEVEVSVSYVPYKDGTATQGILRDVTKRKRMEETLRFQAQLLDSVQESVVATDLDGQIIYWGKGAEALYGYHAAEVVGKPVTLIVEPQNADEEKERMRQVRETGTWRGQYLQRRKDGSSFWADTLISLVTDGDGKPFGLVGVDRDVTARKQSKATQERLTAQIREQAQQMAQILATVPAGVLLLDAEGRIVQANPVAEETLLVLADAQVGDILTQLGDRPLAELLTSPPTEGLWHEVQMETAIFEVIARPLQPVMGADDEERAAAENWVLVARDVTRERKIEQRARRQEQLAAIGQLAAGIAHDFNNIMATIVLYAQMMARTEGLSSRNREQLAAIDDQAKQATDLIQQILDFGRRAVIERKPLDLLPLLKKQIHLLERTLPDNIQVELTHGTDEYTVSADATRIQQAATNLAVNARDAMPQGGRLHIRLEKITVNSGHTPPLPEMDAGQWIRLTFSDTGKGIPSDRLPHVFEPFFTTKEPGQGSGLGLAQVHGIVSQHGGHIDVETQEGEGATFSLYLPALAVRPPELPTETQAELAKGQGETILVVEDNARTRRALVASLENLSYQVVEAANGLEALETLERREVALVLSDLVMPSMGGRALLRTLQERGIEVPVILLTGHPLRREQDTLQETGLNDCLLKPVSLSQLADAVDRALHP